LASPAEGFRSLTKAGIKTHAAVVSDFAQQGEKFPLAAANLDHFLAVQIVLLDHLLSQATMEGLKGAGKALRLLVLRGVVVHSRVEDGVGNKAAMGAMAESNVALGKVHRNFARRHQQYAVHGHPAELDRKQLMSPLRQFGQVLISGISWSSFGKISSLAKI